MFSAFSVFALLRARPPLAGISEHDYRVRTPPWKLGRIERHPCDRHAGDAGQRSGELEPSGWPGGAAMSPKVVVLQPNVKYAGVAAAFAVAGWRGGPIILTAALLPGEPELAAWRYDDTVTRYHCNPVVRQSLVGDEFGDLSEALLTAMFTHEGPCPVSLLRAVASDMIAERYVLGGLTETQLDFLRGTIETDVSIAVAALAALGVAAVDEAGETVELTALGRFAIGRNRGMPLPGEPVLQVRITLMDVADPPVWRRVLVPVAYSLDRVHQVIQAAMGWHNYHMHVFRVGEVSYGRDPEGILGHLEETKVNLADVAEVGERIGYEYDFGDSWEHELFIEARTEAEAGEIYPACTGGEGACPPEDAGGYPGYQQLKEILADPSNEEYEEMRTWADSQVGAEFDPASFDLAQASARVSTA
jgi:Plasmid pRiA4b ORF-3-like protein